jgi:asparagine synthase (glutamine-hydrolysing)
MLADLHGFLQHNFTVADKSSMQESIELRVPLATKELFEEAYKSNRKELFNFFKTKIKLRKLLKGVVPKQIMERKKSGFHPPIDTVINEIGMNELMAIYERNSLFELLDKEAVYSILNTHFSSKTNNTYKIFQLLFLSYWFKSFIKKEL